MVRGGPVELQPIGFAEAGQAVGALLEFVADAKFPVRRVLRRLGESRQVQPPRVVAANDHGKGVLETEGRADGDLVLLLVDA
jgi:hypothetical protein